MKTMKIGTHTVKIYDAIEEMPVLRYHKFTKCLMVDAGIGSDISAVDRHLYKARYYVSAGKPDLAQIELENLRQAILFVGNNITPKLTAFAAIVAEIDGKPQTDITDAALQKVSEMLQSATMKEVTDAVDTEKKKIDDELKVYFAALFDDESDKEYFDLLKARTMLILRGITTQNPDTQQIEIFTHKLLLHVKPRMFYGRDNAEVVFDKNFDKLCIALSEHTNTSVKSMTVFEFYTLYEYAKEKIKQQKKQQKKN